MENSSATFVFNALRIPVIRNNTPASATSTFRGRCQFGTIGHAPIFEHMLLGRRYFTLKKLAVRKNAVFWRCWDTRDCRLVAMKIFANSDAASQQANREIDVFLKMMAKKKKNERLALMLDHFNLAGDSFAGFVRGFQCVVTELYDQSLATYSETADTPLPLNECKHILKQVAEGLRALHYFKLRAHGDLGLKNIMVELKPSGVRDLLDEAIALTQASFEVGVMMHAHPVSESGAPSLATILAQMRTAKINHVEAHDQFALEQSDALPANAKISGLGGSYLWKDWRSADVPTPIASGYNSFETIVGQRVGGCWSDMWAFACMSYELCTDGDELFILCSDSPADQNQEHLMQMMEILGQPPCDRKCYRFCDHYFDQEGDPLMKPRARWSIAATVIEEHDWMLRDAVYFERFMLSLLAYNSRDLPRMSASDASRHQFLRQTVPGPMVPA